MSGPLRAALMDVIAGAPEAGPRVSLAEQLSLPVGEELWAARFGVVGDGVADDTVAAQAAVDAWLDTRETRPAVLRFGAQLRVTSGLVCSRPGLFRGALTGQTSDMAATRILVDFDGCGPDAPSPAVLNFGDPLAPAYQSAVGIAGFQFAKAPGVTQTPIGISGAALAQSRIDACTFGGWNSPIISLLTPQNLWIDRVESFGGGRSFAYKDTAGITVTQNGNTLTASAPLFTATDEGKWVALWGVPPSTYRRKELLLDIVDETTAIVAHSVTDAVARRIFFSSPFITAFAGSAIITADAPIFSNAQIGLPVCVEGAGANYGLLRARILEAISPTQARLSEPAGTTTIDGLIATPAVEIYSPPAFGNGPSEITMTNMRLEQHTGVALVAINADILNFAGKIHAQQTISSSSTYSQAAIWSSRWEGDLNVALDAQYLGGNRAVFGDQTARLDLWSMRLRSAINEKSIRIRPRAAGFEGGLLNFVGLRPVGASALWTPEDFIQDDNVDIPGWTINGAWSLNQADATRNYLGRRVYADSDGLLRAAGLTFGQGALSAYRSPTGWSPVVADAAVGGNVASGTFDGFWMQIGALVLLSCRLVAINTAGLTPGAQLYVRGLPDNVRPNPAFAFMGSARTENVTLTGPLTAFADDNDSHVLFYQNSSGGASSPLLVSALTSGSASIRFSIAYMTDEVA